VKCYLVADARQVADDGEQRVAEEQARAVVDDGELRRHDHVPHAWQKPGLDDAPHHRHGQCCANPPPLRADRACRCIVGVP
jgi:hypothetical protein